MMIETKIEKIQLSLLKPDPRNANVCDIETIEKLRRNIQESGYYPPLVVRIHPDEPENYQIIDGHHRLEVLKSLEYEAAECQVLKLTEDQTRLLLLTLNRLRGADNLRKRAELIQELREAFNDIDLSSLIPESENEIQDLLKLLSFDEDIAERELLESIQKESDELPVILNFVVTKLEDELIQSVINKFLPEGEGNPSVGLVKLCESAKGA